MECFKPRNMIKDEHSYSTKYYIRLLIRNAQIKHLITNKAMITYPLLYIDMKEIYAAIITSLIAALVFWVIFDYLPKIVSNNKIKPIIVYDFYCLYQKMLSFISLPFTHQSFPDSSYSGEIISGSVTEDDFRCNICSHVTFVFICLCDILIQGHTKLFDFSPVY